MGGDETFFVIRPVDLSKMVPKLADVWRTGRRRDHGV